MAPTRSGRGIGTTIPNLLLLDRSVIYVNPKGENARVTARTLSRKGNVGCLDPLGSPKPQRLATTPGVARCHLPGLGEGRTDDCQRAGLQCPLQPLGQGSSRGAWLAATSR
ncbi:type IV secretory system conjugative DNA transfer family protein [Sphingomonas sp. GM_Shp_2]|uniref:type IV secretory system conjugative DNA transfer family protein n=1 Tax=Sphingomonas sp. GM_Shp_2 TaxID=2937380 RepID=UPI00226A04EC|nr:type IV secretory system conjugative DNA transfer family protein [Sphingomonas sp. GM_Shp_2]